MAELNSDKTEPGDEGLDAEDDFDQPLGDLDYWQLHINNTALKNH